MGTVNVYGGTIETSLGNINYYYTAPEPTFTTTQTADSITVEVTNYQDVYGEIQYKWDNGEWGTNDTLPNLGANSEHTVSVRYMGQNLRRHSRRQSALPRLLLPSRSRRLLRQPVMTNQKWEERFP